MDSGIDSLRVGDVVEFTIDAHLLLGVVVGYHEKLQLVKVTLVDSGEITTTGVALSSSAETRELALVSPKAITRQLAHADQTTVQLCWNQATKGASLGYYNTFHKPAKDKPYRTGERIPYAGRVFDEREMLNLIDSSLEFWLTSGRYTERFERDFAKYLGVRKSLLVNSGSSANLVAFMTLTSPLLKDRQVKAGDEVISVACGFPTTIAPAIQHGCVPVFLDVELGTYNVDVSQLEAARTDKTKAVMIAHALGNPFNLSAVKSFCEKHNLWLIEDNCDALGSKYLYNDQWHYTGTLGDIGTSSFYPPHHMTMGEGGAVYMKSPQLYRISASFRDWGRDCWCAAGVDNTCGKRFGWQLGQLPEGYDHKYIYSHMGYNLKSTDMQAAIGCAQLEKIESFADARRKNWKLLRDGLQELQDIFILPEATPNSDPSWFGFLMTVRSGKPGERKRIVQTLEARGIQTRMLFAGNFLRHPAFDQLREQPGRYRTVGDLPNTDFVMNNSFWLGVYPGLSESMIGYMIEQIRQVARERSAAA